VIVVVGDPSLRVSDGTSPSVASGSAAAIARACTIAGAAVQIAGKIGDDPAGNELILALSRDGIGHVALLRDAGRATLIERSPVSADPEIDAPTVDAALALETDDGGAKSRDASDASAGAGASPQAGPFAMAPEDLDLALRYLVSFAVLVVAEPLPSDTLAVAAEAASFSGAHLIVAARTTDDEGPAGVAVTLLEPPLADPDGDFAALVARYAVALDGGQSPNSAFRGALGGSVWERTDI
jgi:hypothetical protein